MPSSEDKRYIDAAISIFLTTSSFKVDEEEFYLFEVTD